jgi:hypothetical protein
MTPRDVQSQIAVVAQLESELTAARKAAAKTLKAQRKALGLSLRAVRPKARRSIAMLSDLERGRTWETKLAERLARVYGADEAA